MAIVQIMTPLQRLEDVMEKARDGEDWFLLKWMRENLKIKEIESTPTACGKATFTFTVDEYYRNGSGNLHGGAASAFYDILTTMVLMATTDVPEAWSNGGVSRSLDVTYLRPVPAGAIVECTCEVLHAAKRLALLRAEMRRQSDGALISTCKHDKASVPVKRFTKI